MKFGGADVGRRYDSTVYVAVTLNGDTVVVSDLVQLASVQFREQADVLHNRVSSTFNTYVDVTGIGQGFYEVLDERGLPVKPLTIVSGNSCKITRTGAVTVGKQYLVSLVGAYLPILRLKLPNNHFLQEFERQMRAFVVKPGPNPTFEGKGPVHDDYVTALGAALVGVNAYEFRYKGNMTQEKAA